MSVRVVFGVPPLSRNDRRKIPYHALSCVSIIQYGDIWQYLSLMFLEFHADVVLIVALYTHFAGLVMCPAFMPAFW